MLKINKKVFKSNLKKKFKHMYIQNISEATEEQMYRVLVDVLKDSISDLWTQNKNNSKHEKEVYYFSSEFLIGKQLTSNLVNLGVEQKVKECIEELGFNFEKIKQVEVEPALGNGGLGRLAACFLDSMASLDIKGNGYGLRYKYGLFEQKIVDGHQVEIPDNWLGDEGYAWDTRKNNRKYVVKFGGSVSLINEEGKLKAIHSDFIPVMAVPYDIPVIGYQNPTINTLRLWNSEELTSQHIDSIRGNKNIKGSYKDAENYKGYAEEICSVLYPDDSTYDGKQLRLKQEYFMVSAGLQDIVTKCKKRGYNLNELYKKIAIHINDTHPSLCIPELMRILIDENGFIWEDAWAVTEKTMSYTNHTILSEAMEKWDVGLVKNLLPRIYMIIEEINRRHCNQLLEHYNHNYEKVESLSIIKNGLIYMANLCIVGSHSINGVAKLHTTILKTEVLKNFYEHSPCKFNNKTNGISHRRWLITLNPELSTLITELIGNEWKKDTSKLKDLESFKEDKKVLKRINDIKYNNKVELANIIKEKNGIDVNPNSIFDIQIKRLHAYKRQLLNALHILHLYHEFLENPNSDVAPRTFIFGAKAASGYHYAKSIIKLINEIGNKINSDERIKGKLKVVFLENYGVTLAEKIIPAADVSEQISTASKEASGTGNMKLMMNGAITVATLDGANVEIRENVGDDNIVLFGLKSEEVINYYKNGSYNASEIYHSNAYVKRVVDDLVNGFIPNIENEGREIFDSLIANNDEYFVLKDFESYIDAQNKIDEMYRKKNIWGEKSLMNIANSGSFSADRTIREYAQDIWFNEKI